MFENIGWAALEEIELLVPGNVPEKLNCLRSTLTHGTPTMNRPWEYKADMVFRPCRDLKLRSMSRVTRSRDLN